MEARETRYLIVPMSSDPYSTPPRYRIYVAAPQKVAASPKNPRGVGYACCNPLGPTYRTAEEAERAIFKMIQEDGY